ncbi:GNAT family N-acetyltransferase [Conyzicola lurida]
MKPRYRGVVTTIAIEPPRQPDVLALMRRADEYALSLYPAESYYSLDVDSLEQPGVSFLVARDEGLAGIVALVDNGDGTAEIKRLFVAESHRGRGVAGALLARLEGLAAAASVSRIRLETGLEQPDAIGLYLKHGYVHIDRFGRYADDPSSVCMEKTI